MKQISSDDGAIGKVSGCVTRVGYEWIYLWSNICTAVNIPQPCLQNLKSLINHHAEQRHWHKNMYYYYYFKMLRV